MNRLRIIFSLLIVLMCCAMHKGMAQTTEQLPDSLVYSVAMYKELYSGYNEKVQELKLELCAVVAEYFGKVSSAEDFTVSHFNSGVVNMSTKLAEGLGADLFSILDLSEVLKNKFGVSVTEEQAVEFSTVENIFDAVRPTGDTVILTLAYYPWRTVFDSRQVHRVSVYEDGIGILEELIKLTSDSIQREIYLNELMNVYDVWCEYADTINAQMDNPISRMQIKCDKARKYVIDCMPLVYGVKRDSINKENVMEPFVVRAYNLLRDALYEQEHKEDLNHTIPLYYFPLAQAFIAYFHSNKNTKAFEKQYHADFDTVDIRLSDMLALEAIDASIRGRNIRSNYDNIKKSYNETCDMMDLGSATNWRELEPIYRNQLAEKRELWDFGVEEPNADFLDRVIRSIKNDSSDVYVEALECYIEYIVPKSTNVADDKVEEYKKKRKSLVNAYLKRERQEEAYSLLAELIGVEKDNLVKAEWYYKRGVIQFEAGKYNNVVGNLRNAVKLNPNYGDAYYLLGQAYSKLHWRKSWNTDEKEKMIDKLIHLLVIDKYQLALESVRRNANHPTLSGYNKTKETTISKAIEVVQFNDMPTSEDWFFSATGINEGDVLNILGEKVRVRFYQ